MAYKDLLLDPRWQRKRLEVLNRDDFTCIACGNQKRTLHVHHIEYKKGKKPWEYSIDDLSTLCEVCHKVHHKGQFSEFETLLIDIIRTRDSDDQRMIELFNTILEREMKKRNV
jgi:hypothetical protein